MTVSVHKLVPSDRVEGVPVFNPAGKKIGTVERLMIDKVTGHIAYAVLKCGGFIGVGEDHVPVSWQSLTYNTARQGYEIGIPESQLRDAVIDEAGTELDLGGRERPYPHARYWDV